jgi:membrane protein
MARLPLHAESRGGSREPERCDTRPVTGSDGHPLGPRDAAEEKPQSGNGSSPRDRPRGRVAAARARYEGSWIQDFVAKLKVLDLANWTTVFGAELLWSVLPLLILLSSLANERIDDDLSRHIGVTGQGVQVIRALFRNSPTFSLVPILTGLLFAFAGTITVVSSMQVLYERAFDQQHRGWQDIPRFVLWLVVLLAALTVEGIISKPVRTTTGPVIEGVVRFLAAVLFFWWTMHFLLAGSVRWRVLIRPALVTAILWLALALLSSISLSSSIVSDSKLYGTIGVVFTFLTWFILVASVLVLGAAFGAVWQNRKGQGFRRADSGARPSQVDEGERAQR